MAKRGTIRRLLENYGFITDETHQDVFFHKTGVKDVSFTDLTVGEEVQFDLGRDPKFGRDRAINVRPAQAPKEQ
jgi:cold shock CspA family protein